MAAPAKVCGVCRSGYRGSYAVHASTDRHRTAERRANTARDSKLVRRSARRERAGAAARAAQRNQDDYLSRTLVRVTRYRRSRPNDGTRKVVDVVRHYRKRPATYSTLELAGGKAYRVLRDLATGSALSFRELKRIPRRLAS